MTSSGGGVSSYYGNLTTNNSVSSSAVTSRGGVLPVAPPSMHPIRNSPPCYASSDLMEPRDALQTPSPPGTGSGRGGSVWCDGGPGGETPGGPQEGHLEELETMLWMFTLEPPPGTAKTPHLDTEHLDVERSPSPAPENICFYHFLMKHIYSCNVKHHECFFSFNLFEAVKYVFT